MGHGGQGQAHCNQQEAEAGQQPETAGGQYGFGTGSSQEEGVGLQGSCFGGPAKQGRGSPFRPQQADQGGLVAAGAGGAAAGSCQAEA
eukprot:5100910-Lingulodinium_polyedra.AAC.1